MGRIETTLLGLLILVAGATANADIPVEVKRALASRDYVTAAVWLNEHRLEPDAAFELGRLYRLGKGVPKDEDEALILFETAGRGGIVEAHGAGVRGYALHGSKGNQRRRFSKIRLS